MTTNELIEKYGIGHNCLSDAYALGLADGLDALEHAVEFAEEKARVDAIEECIKKLEEKYSYHEKQIKYPQYDHYCNGIEDCIDILEGLKDQKNE